MKQRITSLLLAFAIVSAFVCAIPVKASAADNPKTYLAFTSDVHHTSTADNAARLDKWLNAVAKTIGSPIDNVGICGDLGPQIADIKDYWIHAESVMNTIQNNKAVIGNGFFVCGNHEYSPGKYSHALNTVTARYSDAGTVFDGTTYRLYSLGARQYQEIYSDTDINALKAYLEANKSYSYPIFILSHFPLHPYGFITNQETALVHDGNAAVGSAKLIEALNTAAETNGQTIIYLWGHNHSQNNYLYDEVITDKIGHTPISFTYASAGCMQYGEWMIMGKGLIACIDDNHVTFTYYNANGKAVLPICTICQITSHSIFILKRIWKRIF